MDEHVIVDEIDASVVVQKSGRFDSFLNKTETVYLKLLRSILLLIATGLIIYAGLIAIRALYMIAQSPESVEEKVATVTPEELTTAQLPTSQNRRANTESTASPSQRQAYAGLLTRYHRLYRTRFEPFKQREDGSLSRTDFDARFLETQSRLTAVAAGRLNFQEDVADLSSLVETMEAAAVLPATGQRLQRYKQARKVQVCRNVERTRTTYVAGWDAYSISCPNWYENMGCPVQRPVQTPYTARDCSMQFPEGTQSHQQIFRAYQDHFYQLLEKRRRENRASADAQRMSIVDGITEGKISLWTALLVVGAFLVLMFFFLLIAIERHQRRVSSSVGGESGGTADA